MGARGRGPALGILVFFCGRLWHLVFCILCVCVCVCILGFVYQGSVVNVVQKVSVDKEWAL